MSETYISHDGEPPIAELEPLPVYDSLRGQQVQRRWVGSRARITAKYQEILLAGGAQSARVTDALNGMGLQLTVDYAGVYNSATGTVETSQSSIVTEWTSEPAILTKSIWDYPPVYVEFRKLGNTEAGLSDARKLRSFIDAYVRGETTVPDPADPKGVKVLPLTAEKILLIVRELGLSVEVFQQLMAEMIRGLSSYNPPSWNLRRSRRIPAGVSFVEPSTNVGRCLSYTALSGEGFSSSHLRSDLPTFGYWLKSFPVDRPTGDGFRQVDTDFTWLEQFSEFLYGPPVQ